MQVYTPAQDQPEEQTASGDHDGTISEARKVELESDDSVERIGGDISEEYAQRGGG